MENKILVAYFSCTGMTKNVAELIASKLGAEVFQIRPQVPYSREDLDWRNKNSRSSIEMNDLTSRPEIEEVFEDMDQYNIVFVGFPIWWYIPPTIINTFLETYNFSGKTVIPFATSGGSGYGKSDDRFKISCSEDVSFKNGKLIKWDDLNLELDQWLSHLDL